MSRLSLTAMAKTLRGPLKADGLGARGLERIARNPRCQRLAGLSAASILPSSAVRDIYGETALDQRSPMALAQGVRFEHQLFESNAQRLVACYQEADRLPATPEVFAMDALPLDDRVEATRDLLHQRLTDPSNAPALILHPRVELELAGRRHTIEPDALVAFGTGYRVVEIKSYTDRGGRTDTAALRGACRQMAVGVLAVQQTLMSLGFAAQHIVDEGDLILKAPGSMYPILRPMTLSGEVSSIQRMMARLPGQLQAIAAQLAPGESLADPAVLNRLENHLMDGCREFCSLAAICKRQAQDCGALTLLGQATAEALMPAGDLNRVFALMDGAPPKTPEEAALALALQRAQTTLDVHCEH